MSAHYLTAISHSPELDNFRVDYDEFEQMEDDRIYCSVDPDRMSPVHAISTATFDRDGQHVCLYVSDVEHQLTYLSVRFRPDVGCSEVYPITPSVWGMTVYFEGPRHRTLEGIISDLREGLDTEVVELPDGQYKVRGCITDYEIEVMSEQDLKDAYHSFMEE